MRTRGWPPVYLWLGVFALQGCGETPPAVHVHTGTTGGISYEVRGTGHTTENRSANGGVEVTMGPNHLQIKGGRVVANCKSSVVVKDGDKVLLDDKGQHRSAAWTHTWR